MNNYKGEAIYYANMGEDFKIEILGDNIVYPAVDAGGVGDKEEAPEVSDKVPEVKPEISGIYSNS